MNTEKATATIVLAGATGDLGHRIAIYLRENGATVKALIRKGSSSSVAALKRQGVQIIEVDFNNAKGLTAVCKDASCVVSAMSGLRDVIMGAQTQLMNAAVKAGVPRFIPSDYCIDYTKLPTNSNRNLDLRREFNEELNKAPIAATSILNGMFADLLTGKAPIILKGIKRVLFWGDPNQLLDFTTTDNTAAFTAAAALDPSTPRYLRIAGEVASPKDLLRIASEVTGQPFKLLRPGGLDAFKVLIKITQTLAPQKGEIFPAWQGMQYMHNMFTGLPKLNPLDNHRYPKVKWTSVAEVLSGAV